MRPDGSSSGGEVRPALLRSLHGVENLGPIQLLTIAFDGNHFKGEILPELDRLKHEGIIRIVDLLLIRKDEDGRVMKWTGSDLDWDEATAFGSYIGALAGFDAAGPAGVERGAIAGAAELADGHLFDEDDAFRLTQALPNSMSAALVLIEHLWAKPLREALERADGIELANEWLRPDELLSPDRRL